MKARGEQSRATTFPRHRAILAIIRVVQESTRSTDDTVKMGLSLSLSLLPPLPHSRRGSRPKGGGHEWKRIDLFWSDDMKRAFINRMHLLGCHRSVKGEREPFELSIDDGRQRGTSCLIFLLLLMGLVFQKALFRL